MTSLITKITNYYGKIPETINNLFRASPDEADKVVQEILARKNGQASLANHDVKPATASSRTAVVTGVLATTLATAAVLAGWKVAVGGYIIYQGARWIRGKHRSDPPLEIAVAEEEVPHPPTAEAQQTESDTQQEDHQPPPAIQPQPIQPQPAPPPVDQRLKIEELTFSKVLKKNWNSVHYFHEKIYKAISVATFFMLKWFMEKMGIDVLEATRKAGKKTKKISYVLTGISYLCLIPLLVSFIQLFIKKKKD